ncbi:NADH:ubiquinone oxidoreductase [Brachyspira hyodysenteriae]|uniref:NADH:ubiquinone oxidoreductase n=1 Tax=Brachyspira hyodysenteriae TaxID=159 RepID=UPI002B260443|nr:NADH:ubiquinone oxidoreductase [Brachyspira hyodysenteriae]WPC37372.1 NADH:ubiquinone oxidoreductase [Brachyspira hyodysenteriae]
MNSKKNRMIFSFICFILYIACSFVPFLRSFNLLKIFFILPAFLYSPVYSIGIVIVSYLFLLVFSIIKLLPYLNNLVIVFLQTVLRNSANVLINILFVVLASLIIYFFKKRASEKGIDINISMALIIAVIITFLEFIVSTFYLLIYSGYGVSDYNTIIMKHSFFYINSMIFTFIAVIVSYFIYMKIKDKPFFANNLNNNDNNQDNDNNLNKDNNVNNINE